MKAKQRSNKAAWKRKLRNRDWRSKIQWVNGKPYAPSMLALLPLMIRHEPPRFNHVPLSVWTVSSLVEPDEWHNLNKANTLVCKGEV